MENIYFKPNCNSQELNNQASKSIFVKTVGASKKFLESSLQTTASSQEGCFTTHSKKDEEKNTLLSSNTSEQSSSNTEQTSSSKKIEVSSANLDSDDDDLSSLNILADVTPSIIEEEKIVTQEMKRREVFSELVELKVPENDNFNYMERQSLQFANQMKLINLTYVQYRDRYSNIQPLKHNTLQLKNGTVMNGSPISFKEPFSLIFPKYIAMSAPHLEFVPETLTMYYEMDVKLILNLTDYYEGDSRKADPYLPGANKTDEFKGYEISNLEVTNIVLSNKVNYDIKKYRITRLNDQTINHEFIEMHVHGWADQSAVTDSILMTLIQESRALYQKGPIVVHCSAGIGRTGTFMTANELYENPEENVTMLSLTARAQREGMVQTKEQYQLLFDFKKLCAKQKKT